MFYDFITSHGTISATLVASRIEAVQHCHATNQPSAFFEKEYNAFRVFRPITKQSNNEQFMHDYCASVKLPAREKFELISSLVV